ncbi:unnamed protein product, partial [Ectocarpus sp. 12 AP-2014]
MGSGHGELDRPGDVHNEGGTRHPYQLRMDCPRGAGDQGSLQRERRLQ